MSSTEIAQDVQLLLTPLPSFELTECFLRVTSAQSSRQTLILLRSRQHTVHLMSQFQALGPAAAELAALLQAGNYRQIPQLLDSVELQVTAPQLPQDWPYAIHLLGHLHAYNLEDARFLCKRVPAAAKQDPELKAACAVLQHLWNKDYEGTWVALSAHTWQPAAAPLVTALAARIRQRTLGVLSAAYSTITAGRAAAFLGLPEADAVALVQQAGWQHDPATNMLKVHRQAGEAALPSHAEHLQRLTEYMIDLEPAAAAAAAPA